MSAAAVDLHDLLVAGDAGRLVGRLHAAESALTLAVAAKGEHAAVACSSEEGSQGHEEVAAIV